MQSKQSAIVAQVKCVVGLGALLSTLLIYSVCVLAFLINHEFLDFVVLYAPIALIATAIIALVVLVAALRGTLLNKPLVIASGPVYVVGALGFVLLANFNINQDWVTILCALVIALGDVLLCLVWGRVFSRFSLRQALITVSLASALAAGVYWLLISLPIFASNGLFIIMALLAAVMPYAIGRVLSPKEHTLPAPRKRSTLLSLLEVAGLPMGGLVACSFCFALLREGLTESFTVYLSSVLIVVAILLVFAFFIRRALNLHGLYMTLLPVLSVLVLAVAGFTEQINMSSDVLMVFVFVLYLAAAIITLATLSAVAHAGEFSSDLLFGTALFLFGASSALGQGSAELISEDSVNLVVIIVTMIYALVSLFTFFIRWFKEQGSQAWHRLDAADETLQNDANAEQAQLSPCELLAEAHQLTTRELEILVLLADGHRGPYISETLFISQNTVRTHIHNIYRKLDVSSREDILRITHPKQ